MANSLPKFETLYILQEHRSGVNVVKISPDGSLLLSGAQDGTVIIWDLVTGRSVQTFKLSSSHGITAAVWCPYSSGRPVEAFAIREAVGRVTVYQRMAINYDYACAAQAFTSPMEHMAYDPRHRRIAMVGDGCLKLYALDAAYTLSFLHSTVPREHTARSTAFYADGACVFVCYLESGHVTGYTISPWSVQFDGDLETRIGYATLVDGGDLFVTNLMNGMDLYAFPTTPVPRRNVRFHIDRNYPLTVAVSPAADFAVVGGEDGHARVYDIHRGFVDGMLPHGNLDSLVQQVDVHVSAGKCIVVTGCADDTDGSLKVWTPSGSRNFVVSSPVNESWARKALWIAHAFPSTFFFLFAMSALVGLISACVQIIPASWSEVRRQAAGMGPWVQDALVIANRWWKET